MVGLKRNVRFWPTVLTWYRAPINLPALQVHGPAPYGHNKHPMNGQDSSWTGIEGQSAPVWGLQAGKGALPAATTCQLSLRLNDDVWELQARCEHMGRRLPSVSQLLEHMRSPCWSCTASTAWRI